jgi:Family of unknown function (DUF6491)
MRLAAASILATASLVVALGAQAQTREVQKENLERFEKYAGAPVDEFRFFAPLYKWQLVGPEKVVVWPTINQAYLITVAEPCPKLEWAKGIGVTSKQQHTVSSKFDYVTYGGGRCQITEIRPIDYKQMLKDGPDKK